MFKELGYYKEFYLNGKMIGLANCELDREEIGYNGRKKEIFDSTIVLTNNKKIKPQVEYLTIVYPLCGKTINNCHN